MFFHRRPMLISKTWEVVTRYRAHHREKRVSTPKRQTELQSQMIPMSAVYAPHKLALILSQYPILTEIIHHSHRPDLINLMRASKGVHSAIFSSAHGRSDPFKNSLCANFHPGPRCIACGTRTCTVRPPAYLLQYHLFTGLISSPPVKLTLTSLPRTAQLGTCSTPSEVQHAASHYPPASPAVPAAI